jgi:hypothetical protein
VSSPADGGVDEDTGWHRRKKRDDFVTQDRNVLERLDHLQPPDWWEERSV